MESLKFIFGTLLILFGSFIIGANYACIFINRKNAKKGIDKHHSFSPLIGPVSFMIGASFVNLNFSILMIIVFIIDPGTWLIVIGLPYAIFKGSFSIKRKN